MRCSVVIALLVVLLGAWPFEASAQAAWPTKPVHLIVPFPAGGQLDVVSRLIGDRLSPLIGQPVIVEAKPGADGNIATETVAKSAPDGYTWLAASPPTTIQPSVRPKTLRYDPLRDFQAVAFIGTSPFLFVVPHHCPSTRSRISLPTRRRGPASYRMRDPRVALSFTLPPSY